MKLRSHAFVNEHFPDAWIYEDCILYIDQNERAFTVKGFEVHGQPMSNLSQEHLAGWRAAAQAMLNALEMHTHLSFYWTLENDYANFIEGHRQGIDPLAPPLARQLLEERLQNYQRQQLSNELRYRKLYVFVNFEPPPSKLRSDEALRGKLNARKNHRLLLSEWKAARQKLEQIISVVRHPFESCGMNTAPLNHEKIRRLFRRALSPHHARLRVNEPQENRRGHLWSETLHSDIERRREWLWFDEHYHAFLSMTNLPQETLTGFLHHLFNLSHPDYALCVTLRTTEKHEEIRKLQSDYGSKQGLQLALQRSGKITNVEMETQAQEIRDEIRTLTQTPQQIFHIQITEHFWHPEEDVLRSRVDEAILKTSYCNGIQSAVERIAAPEALRACLPGWTREARLDRFHVVKSINAADFIPAHTDFLGTGRPQLLFPTPEGGLMAAHVFTVTRPFHNVVLGATGSGKTFAIDSIATQLVSQGLRSVSVISTKDEFGPLMAMYDGIKISFKENEPVFLNVCLIAGDKPTEDELASMTAILETIFGEEPNDTERKVRQSRILKAVKLVFNAHGSKTRLRHFVDVFRNGWEHDNMDELQRLAVILEPYAQGGIYGEYFDSDTRRQLDLSNQFKFFDFSGIQKNKNLSAVMMMALTNAEALRLSKLPRSVRKALILDECWAFVNSAAGGDFIENALRVYRAYNCAVFLSSQAPTDFLESRIAPVISTNCDNYFLLRTKDPKAVEKMRQELNLTQELAACFGAMPDPSEVGYSHFIYVHRGEAQLIAGEAINRTSREEALLYSTSPNISERRDQALRDAKDPWEAVTRLAQDLAL